jgi:hypothetical protein
MIFGTWNVWSLYRVGSLKTVAGELANYNLDLMAVREVTWVEGGSQPGDDYNFFPWNGNTHGKMGNAYNI